MGGGAIADEVDFLQRLLQDSLEPASPRIARIMVGSLLRFRAFVEAQLEVVEPGTQRHDPAMYGGISLIETALVPSNCAVMVDDCGRGKMVVFAPQMGAFDAPYRRGGGNG